MGAWRETEGKFPIDASGQLPDGRKFTGPNELRDILSADRDAFSRAITSKLLTYALGRGLERYDSRTVKLIASRLPSYNYKFSGLVLEIVNSLPFQSRRSATDGPGDDDKANCHRVGKRRVRIGAPLRKGRRTDQAEALE